MKSINRVKLAVALTALSCVAVLSWCWRAGAAPPTTSAPEGYELPYGGNPFAPSNAKTTTGGFISQSEFIPAERCASCHRGVHAEWKESAHRNSFREPFYQTNVRHLIRDRRIAVTRHCESCHNPAALFSGALSDNAKMGRPFDEEGVTCSVCHSIESVATRGIGSYTLAPPAVLVREDGTRLRDASDAEIRGDLASHKRAVMRPLLKTPELCAACHKAAVVPEMNGRKWLRSFSVYDEWQQSSMSGETVQPLNKRERQSCQSCHMPPSGTGYASHRWPGANTAIPAYYKWPEQTAATTALLQSQALNVDIFAVRAGAQQTGDSVAPLLPANSGATNFLGTAAGGKVTVDVVVSNRNVGHSFPPEQRDIYEAWLEFEARDASGRVVYHSGAVNPDGTLDASAHAYRTIPIDSSGSPITKHDIWNTRVGAFDRHIPAGRADLGCFSFDVLRDARLPLRLTARLNYRRFNKHYMDWVARETKGVTSPVTLMAEASAMLGAGARESASAPRADAAPDLRKRWRSYGVALFDLQRYEQAAAAFARALELAPEGSADEAASCVDVAMALMRLERAGESAATLERAEASLARALEVSPGYARARFYRGLLGVKRFRYTQALEDLEGLAREFPRDRQTWHQVAALYLLQRRDREALAAYEHVLEIDPDDNEANFKLAGLYWRFQMTDRAKRTQDAYQSRHPDTVGETLRRDYLRARPEIYLTWPWHEYGDNPIGSNP
jgi:tetratricopeptide (TPR) repeat protein